MNQGNQYNQILFVATCYTFLRSRHADVEHLVRHVTCAERGRNTFTAIAWQEMRPADIASTEKLEVQFALSDDASQYN